ncbi:MAG: very short patch repair endonuclease [Vicinamibacterales bacterium]
MDRLTKARRSWNMSRIKGRDTGPELAVRSVLHRLGFRFRLHRRDLPGRPDLVLVRLRVVIFVHGCFWHQHKGCRFAYKPKSNAAFWLSKLASNVERDRINVRELKALGWNVLTVWECQTSDVATLAARLAEALRKPGQRPVSR